MVSCGHQSYLLQTYRINKAAAELAKKACQEVEAATGEALTCAGYHQRHLILVFVCVGVPRYVVGSIGPTNRTLSISPSVTNPEYRNISKCICVHVY